MTACRLAVGHQRPFQSRKGSVVGDVDKSAKRAHAPDNLVRGSGNLVEVLAENLDPDGKRAARAFLLLCDAEIGAGKTADEFAHPLDQRRRLVTLVPVGEDRAYGADGITRSLVATAAGPEGSRVEILYAGDGQDRRFGGVHETVTLFCRQVTACQNLNLCLVRLDVREE